MIQFGLVFGITGLLISLVVSLFSQNSVMAVVSNVVFSFFVSFLLGAGVFWILKQKVPEVLELYEMAATSSPVEKNFEEDALSYEQETDLGEQYNNVYQQDLAGSGETLMDSAASQDISFTDNVSRVREEKVKHFGDHILVDKIPIKNEPKLMAQAIRTMLMKDG